MPIDNASKALNIINLLDETTTNPAHHDTFAIVRPALVKQIPQRLASRQKNRTRVSGKCPTCGRNFSLESIIHYRQNMKHCPNCGQAIDWSEES